MVGSPDPFLRDNVPVFSYILNDDHLLSSTSMTEEEEEGTGITSDVVKVKGEDPATPGPLS